MTARCGPSSASVREKGGGTMVDRQRDAQRSLIGRLPDLAKSVLVLSLGGVFMAEESLRKATRDLKLPRDAVDLVLSQAERGKKDLFDAIARETSGVIREVDIEGLARRILKDFEIEIEARLVLTPRPKNRRKTKPPSSRSRRRKKIRVTYDLP
jgi:hypothetical protein